jgi:hypothetical protein
VSVFSGSLNILLPDICSSSVCFCLSSFLDVLLVVPSFSSALGVPSDNIDSKKLDEKQFKLDGDKSKLWGGKAKGADTSDEKSKKDKEADKSDQKLNLKDKEMKSDLNQRLSLFLPTVLICRRLV